MVQFTNELSAVKHKPVGVSRSASKAPVSRGNPLAWKLKHASLYVEVDGLRAHYLKAGKGQVVLLLSSQVIIARSYKSTISALAKDFSVLCLELPGCGFSDSVITPLTHTEYAQWITHFLKKVGVDKAIVIGHSDSSAPAIALASRYPEVVSHLVLTSAIGAHAPRQYWKLFLGRFCGAWLELSYTFPGTFHGLFNVFFQSRTFWHQIRVSSELDLMPEAAQISAPTLLAWGQNDFTCPITFGMRYTQAIRDTQVHISSGSHNWLIMRPEEFRAAMLVFIDKSS